MDYRRVPEVLVRRVRVLSADYRFNLVVFTQGPILGSNVIFQRWTSGLFSLSWSHHYRVITKGSNPDYSLPLMFWMGHINFWNFCRAISNFGWKGVPLIRKIFFGQRSLGRTNIVCEIVLRDDRFYCKEGAAIGGDNILTPLLGRGSTNISYSMNGEKFWGPPKLRRGLCGPLFVFLYLLGGYMRKKRHFDGPKF